MKYLFILFFLFSCSLPESNNNSLLSSYFFLDNKNKPYQYSVTKNIEIVDIKTIKVNLSKFSSNTNSWKEAKLLIKKPNFNNFTSVKSIEKPSIKGFLEFEISLLNLYQNSQLKVQLIDQKDNSYFSDQIMIDNEFINSMVGYIKSTNSLANDFFGNSIAMSGDGNSFVVGAWGEDSDKAKDNGSVHLYKKINKVWKKSIQFRPSSKNIKKFGFSVAINQDGTVIAVGSEGGFFVMKYNGKSWSSQEKSSSNANSFLGYAISLSKDGKTLAVSDPRDSSAATNINGSQTDTSKPNSGAVYIYNYIKDNWIKTSYLKANNTDKDDQFGFSIDLSFDGTKIIVGAPFEDSNSTEINTNHTNNEKKDSGAAYIYKKEPNWVFSTYIKAANPDEGDKFGYSVAYNDLAIAVGAPFEDSNSIFDPSDNSKNDSGAIYIYKPHNKKYLFSQYIKSSTIDFQNQFGANLVFNKDGKVLAISSPNESIQSTGINNILNTSLTSRKSGAVFVYRLDNVYKQKSYVKSINTDINDLFGYDLSLDDKGDILIISAPQEDSSNRGIGFKQDNNNLSNSGAVYIY